jgi:8-oxo-dGTP pyrophosphatase MutT (NUDIX family)
VTDKHRTAVEETLARLEADYGSVPTRTTEWAVDRETYEQTRERAAAGTVGGAGAWVRRVIDGTPQALLVREHGADGWSEPAGKQEPGERLETTARRETREETGVDCRLTGVRLAARAIHTHPDRLRLHRLVVVFDAVPTAAGTDTAGDDPAALDPRDSEIDAARWVSDHPESLRYDAVGSFPITPPE